MGSLFRWTRKPEPVLGQVRVVRKLIIIPYELSGEYRFLGLERIKQERKEVRVPLKYGFTRNAHRWVDVEWAA